MTSHDSTVIVVFGASGDLAKKKTFPALFGVYKHEFMPPNSKIFGYARSQMDEASFHSRITEKIKVSDSEKHLISEFVQFTEYVQGKYDETASFQKLNSELEKFEGSAKNKRRIFYLATPPSVYGVIAKGLKESCYVQNGANRVVIEKPFGMDTQSSRELGQQIGSLWKEDEIYRIDHYLGKEMVKNIITLRFANVFFSAIWNRERIDNVQITFKEPFGTEGRGGYFDEFGIIRDVIQNHLIQVLCYVAMDKPKSLSSEDIRDEKVKVLKCIAPLKKENLVVGQYIGSEDGTKPAYKDDETVNNDSNVPTYAAVALKIDNDRWRDVPFLIKCGKALDEHKVEIRIQFREVPGALFGEQSRNELVIRLQPNEAVYVKFINKLPGLEMQPIVTELDLTYKDRFPDKRIPDAYEALILDVLNDNHSNFVRDDELDAAWEIFTPILHQIDAKEIISEPYHYGSRGPASADELIYRHGYRRGTASYTWGEGKNQKL